MLDPWKGESQTMNKTRIAGGLSIVILALSVPLADYLFLPAWTLLSLETWVLVSVYLSLFGVSLQMVLGKKNVLPGAAAGVLPLGAAMAISAASWLLWPGNDARYYARLGVDQRSPEDFTLDFPGEGISSGDEELLLLPALDKELSRTLAQGKLGNYGAQFQIDDTIFSSMSLQRDGKPAIYRVAPLDYSGTAVALSNRDQGTAGYIEVDQESGATRLVEVSGGLKYTPKALFGYNLARHIRTAYRDKLFDAWSFEIDDQGDPFWAVPTHRPSIGLFGGPVREGVVVVDAVTGSHEFYLPGTEPAWLDRSVSVGLVMDQAKDYLGLAGGWVNLVMGPKKDVFQLSDSYAYVVSNSAAGSRTWFVSGITSPNEADQTLTGMLMVDLKSGEARRYPFAGITEMRAMEIVMYDERVRPRGLAASWPFLVDVDGTPAFAMILKNDVQRQRFAYVDLETGQKVAIGDTRESARSQFIGLVGGVRSDSPAIKHSGRVLRVKDRLDEDTMLFMLQGEPYSLYSSKARDSLGVYFLSPGDQVVFTFRESDAADGMRYVTELRNITLGE